METSESTNQLLKKKWDLHNPDKAPEVEAAAIRHHGRTGERVPQDPLARIQNYLNRFHEITDREDPAQREHGIDAMKRLLYRKYVIKPDDISESYWENQRRIIRERGQGADLEQVDFEELKRQNTEAIIADQRSSLDKWIDYLSSPDAPYSDGLKYFTLRSVLNMSEYDKEKKMYPQRSKGTTKPFPDLNREALAYVLDAVGKKYAPPGSAKAKGDTEKEGEEQQVEAMPQQVVDRTPEEIEQQKLEQEQFEKLLQGENFAKLYAWAIEKVTPASAEGLANTQGQWVRFTQGSDHMPLVQSLQGHGTGWCTAGESTAAAQLKGGDFYVYYSNSSDGKPTIPRVAIRMEGSQIAEVRGIAPEQNLDGGIVPVVDEKLKEFPDGATYQKKVADMKRLTEIEHKATAGEPVNAVDLGFLYEIDSPIQGFGYSRDPRIEELRSQRNPEEDMPIVFGCDPAQIAHSPSEIRPDTKAYVGSLVPGIFNRLQEHHIEHVYTSFPEGKVRRQQVEIGGKTREQLQQELEQAGVTVTSYAQDMMRSQDFTTLPVAEIVDTVRLRVEDLGFHNSATIDQLYKKAEELGLDLCPSEVGPHMRLATKDQPIGDYYWIGMKQITDSYGNPDVFLLARGGVGLWLDGPWAGPDLRWDPEREFVFSLRKQTQNPQSLGFFGRIFKH